MKTIHPLLIAIFLLSAAGCAKSQNRIEIPKNAAEMSVAFTWDGIAPCTHESPEIHVDGIPEGTAALRVRLKNINVPEWNQGGGSVEHDGTGVIPARALDVGYNGPCPPPGQRYKYEFSVMAVDAGGTIVGFGKAVAPFPPKP
ncbi:MAG TPA: hypothetical protein VLT88_15460 [Desulfosarcina sp.]|nr:hypothetical protein [Desulfosarcina sp.]